MTTTTRSPERPDIATAELAAAARMRTIDLLRDSLEHELRSPLNSVVLNLELVKELVRSGGGDSAVIQLERLESISSAIVRLQQGLNELLELATDGDADGSRFDLSGVAADVAALVGGQLRQLGLGLAVELADDLPIQGRRRSLTHALLHLAMYVARSSPAERQVRLSTRRVDGEMVFDVRDFGDGGAPELPARGSDWDEESEASDLLVAKKLIEADGGRVSLISSDSNGTLLRAHFPEART